MPLRVKLAIGAFAGVTVAWLIPKGGTPAPVATPTATPPGHLTAAEEPLGAVPAGVSFRTIDGVRVFLVRTGDTVAGFHGVATSAEDGPIHWCIAAKHFESADGRVQYDRGGKAMYGGARRDLDGIQVLASAGRVTIFPHTTLPGAAAAGLPEIDTTPCAASDRVG